MGIWKLGCSIRLRPETKAALEEFAIRERRTFGNLGAVLLEWALGELQKAGSTERLLRRKVPVPAQEKKTVSSVDEIQRH
jgi:hypothetical protein